jgi:hypothetical protein
VWEGASWPSSRFLLFADLLWGICVNADSYPHTFSGFPADVCPESYGPRSYLLPLQYARDSPKADRFANKNGAYVPIL